MRGTSRRLPSTSWRNIAAAAARNVLSAIVDVNAVKLLATWTAKAASFKVSAAVGRQSAYCGASAMAGKVDVGPQLCWR